MNFFKLFFSDLVMNIYGDFDEKSELSDDGLLTESRIVELESTSLQVGKRWLFRIRE